MEKQKNSSKLDNNQTLLLIGLVALVLMVGAGGIIEAIFAVIGGIIGLVIGLIGAVIGIVVGVLGAVLGLVGAIIGIVIGILPILVPIMIVVAIVKGISGEDTHKAKRKHTIEV